MVFRNTGAGTQASMPTILIFAAAYDRPPQRKWFVSCLDVLDKGRDGLSQVTATTRREPASQCETEPNSDGSNDSSVGFLRGIPGIPRNLKE